MKLVIGGAYQGKLAYAKEAYGIADGWIDGRSCALEAIWTCSGISHFHEYVRRMMTDAESEAGLDSFAGEKSEAGMDSFAGAENGTGVNRFAGEKSETGMDDTAGNKPAKAFTAVNIEEFAAAFIRELYEKNPSVVIISNELGCGVVPVERFDRMWREMVGRMCVCAAGYSDEVVRVVCGLGMKLK